MPPGPRLPRVAQTVGLMLGRERFLESCRRRHGELVTFRTVLGPPFVVVFDPALIRELLRASPDRARAGAANAATEPLHGGHSLLLLDGAEHLRQRRLLTPAFHGDRMRSYELAMRAAADRAIDSWPLGRPFALAPSMYALTLEVIMRAVFGVGDDRFGAELERAVRAMLGAGTRSFPRRRREVDALLYAEIRRRRAAPDLAHRSDALSSLIATTDEAGEPISDDELHDELITLLVAGHETTAAALTWAFALLLRHPRALKRLRASLEAGEREYLDAVIKETLRLRPVATGIGRMVCERPLPLAGFQIPPGIEISPSIAAVHRGRDHYPDPHEFRPERFLGPDAPGAETWLPFGGGTRRCLGASFASFEMAVVIARVLERTRLAPAGRRAERTIRRRVTPPTPAALGRSLRRGRRELPRRGARVIQPSAPAPAR